MWWEFSCLKVYGLIAHALFFPGILLSGHAGSSLCAMLRQCLRVSYFLAHFLDGGVTQVDTFFVNGNGEGNPLLLTTYGRWWKN